MAKLKGYTLIEIPSYLYRRLTKYDLSLYRRLLPLTLLAEYAPGRPFTVRELNSVTEDKLTTYLELLTEDKVLLVVDDGQGEYVLRPVPPRGGVVGKSAFRVQVKNEHLALVEKMLGKTIARWVGGENKQRASRLGATRPTGPRPANRVAPQPVAAVAPVDVALAVLPVGGPSPFYVGDGVSYIQRDGVPLALTESQARQVAITQAFLNQRPYYLYLFTAVAEISPDLFTG